VLILLPLATAWAQEPLTLSQALDMTTKLSPDIQLARLDALEREADALRTRSAYGPQLSAQLGTAYQQTNLQGIGLAFPGFSNRIGPYRTFDARPALRQTILDLSLWSEIKASQARIREARQRAEVVREEAQYAVLQLYLQVLEAGSRVTASEARVKTAAAVRDQTADRVQSGTSAKLDLERAEAELADEQVRATQARRERDVLKTLLARTIGVETEIQALAEPPVRDRIMTAEEAIAQAVQDRPELKTLSVSREVNREEAESARRQRWPKLGVSGDFGALGAGPNQAIGTWAVGASLTVPLWTSGRIESDIRAAGIRAQKIDQQVRDVKLRIVQEARQAHTELEAAREALRSAQKSSASSRETLELTRLRVTAGLATSLDTVVAQGRLAQAEDQEIRTRYQFQLAQARMARARGNVRGFLD
jgi:outer membrane protein TolC